MRPSFLAVTAILALGTIHDALAWGADGHSIIGEIADRRLSAEARQGVAELIGAGTSLASISNWADDERARDRRTSRWHYVDIPLSADDYQPARDCALDPREGDCIVAAITRNRTDVACLSEPLSGRRRALMFLLHFMGDLHQPLHAVDEARGGNDIKVTIAIHNGINGNGTDTTNLHAAWDAALIRKSAWSWGAYVEDLEARVLPSLQTTGGAGTVETWAIETHRVAQEVFKMQPSGGTLDDVYLTKARPILDQQLAVAGLRLASVLNDAFAAKRCRND